MTRFLRLCKEAIAAVLLLKNPFAYINDRRGRSKGNTLMIRLRNGVNYRVHTNTADVRIINEIWNLKIYDRLRRFVTDTSTIVDIGAHIGVFTIKAARWGKHTRVFSFEPMPGNYALLSENITLNHLEKRITPIQKAIAETPGTKTLYVKHQDSGSGSIYKDEKHESTDSAFTVQAIRLEDVFRDYHIERCDFMKIDCEGGEVPILTTLPSELLSKIQSLSIEWHDDLSPMPLKEFMAFLTKSGYATEFDEPTGTLYAAR